MNVLPGLAVAFALALTVGLAPATAAARCGTGQPLNYDDIESALVTNDYRISDAYRDQTHPAEDLASSTYWLFFWETGPARFPTQYSQYTLKGSVGTYQLSATLADARDILKRDDYFSLSPQNYVIAVTEQTFSVLTILRCAVVTRLIMDNNPQFQEAATAKIFRDFDNLIASSRLTKVSNAPTDFKSLRLFDP
jgi:hypothetical protein